MLGQASGYIYRDIRDVIPLTSRNLPLPQPLIDEPAQFSQQVRPEQRTACPSTDYEVGFENIGPLNWQRAQPAIGARIRHAVSAPVVAHGEKIERLPA